MNSIRKDPVKWLFFYHVIIRIHVITVQNNSKSDPWDENRSQLPRHARENGHPVILSLSSMTWIPASAGMTESGHSVTGFRDTQPVLVLRLIEKRFWGGVNPDQLPENWIPDIS
jgi:hypothetical protein